MKRFSIFGLAVILGVLLVLPSSTFAQGDQVRPSLKASVSQTLGVDTNITIVYSRPGVKGRKIWGELVPYGLAPGNRYSKDQPYPWRAGANENTTIEFNKDVKIAGNKLAAGKYSIHMVPSESDWVVIFNTNNAGWGSYAYNKEEDALRITVTPKKASNQEWLAYGFGDLAATSTTAYLHWEELVVPFKIEVVTE
ncbi:MAG: DUF2911 domain-containing protein [Candidatus Aminicenantaceae bacterium]